MRVAHIASMQTSTHRTISVLTVRRPGRGTAARVHRRTGGEDDIDRLRISDPDPYTSRASDYMSAPVAFLTRDMELSDPIVKKFLNTFSGLPVVDKNRHVVGILSRKDVARFLAFSRRGWQKKTVKDAMTSPAHWVTEHAPVAQVWSEMMKYKVWRLPVVTKETIQLVGVITRSDILSPILGTDKDVRTRGEDLARGEQLQRETTEEAYRGHLIRGDSQLSDILLEYLADKDISSRFDDKDDEDDDSDEFFSEDADVMGERYKAPLDESNLWWPKSSNARAR